MLTRLKVTGFKNLVDVDVRFGPFTCIAGANGVGKSNLFDAIIFLSALAEKSLMEAAMSVRDKEGRASDIRNLFHRVGDENDHEMSFEAEMIVPRTGIDDLGQEAKASITFLRYSLSIAYRSDNNLRSQGRLEITNENLVHITLGDASKHLLFPHDVQQWRKTAVVGRRFAKSFISTNGENADRVIRLHHESQEGDSGGGRPLSRLATTLPRTVLSTVNAAESRTAAVAKMEMKSWRLLQLEPSALRQPDSFNAPTQLGADGSHLPATLYHLAHVTSTNSDAETSPDSEPEIYVQVANRLANLISDVKAVSVDRDESRELLTLLVTGINGTTHPARALSDGTLRFLALAVLALDPAAQGLLCLEEPENGIHPERIPAMLRLLLDIAIDVTEPVSPDNPLRQVIINTHSPAVVAQIPDDSLIFAESIDTVDKTGSNKRASRAIFSCLPETWRAKESGVNIVARGKMLAYLNPLGSYDSLDTNGHIPASNGKGKRKVPRVMDREDMQPLLSFPE